MRFVFSVFLSLLAATSAQATNCQAPGQGTFTWSCDKPVYFVGEAIRCTAVGITNGNTRSVATILVEYPPEQVSYQAGHSTLFSRCDNHASWFGLQPQARQQPRPHFVLTDQLDLTGLLSGQARVGTAEDFSGVIVLRAEAPGHVVLDFLLYDFFEAAEPKLVEFDIIPVPDPDSDDDLIPDVAEEYVDPYDADDDGVADIVDNCTFVWNGITEREAFQCDTDRDRYGNHCDGDFDNDGAVTSGDVGLYFVPDYQTGTDSGRGTDMNCDGSVDDADLDDFWIPNFSQYGKPGPSGLHETTTVP